MYMVVINIKVKCPKCGYEFEEIENPAPVIPSRIERIERSERVIGASFLASPTRTASFVSTTKPQVYQMMKKGYNEIIETIEKENGATWTELKDATKLSKSTLSQRLKEAKSLGVIEHDIRKKSGNRIYKMKK